MASYADLVLVVHEDLDYRQRAVVEFYASKMNIPKRNSMIHGEDKISKLPDLILGRILSFLKVKEAVRTCVLSTRWIDVWKSISNIHLDDRWIKSTVVNNKEHFAKVVNKVIHLNGNSTIENFSLLISSDKKYEPYLINQWLAAVSRKNIQKLHIKYSGKEAFRSFFSFFCHNSLVHMVLDMNCSLIVPNTVCFPNLQSLKLCRVVFLKEVYPRKNEVIFSFPVLKVIEAIDCEWFQNFCIDAPQLESISLMTSKRVSHKSTIKIFAEHIETFSFYGDLLYHNVVIEDPSSVLNCSTQVFLESDYPMSKMQELSFQTCIFLKQFHEAQYLNLGTGTNQVLAYAKDLFTKIIPNFDRLDQLVLEKFTIEMLFKFLQKATFLEILKLENVEPFDEGDLYSSTILSTCLPYSLEVVLILGFKGNEHEIRLVKFILDNAEWLERMIISTEWKWNSDRELEKIKSHVLAYAKRSKIAEVDFIINVRGDNNLETSAYGNSILKKALRLI
ncbi:F-box/FBD/LRR-repeat protein At3g14710-like [Abrus precatorius]|uniref:F-box/FBD/LRR-repeat protein At3g14710-like n=1 Tax=Abrus precatorius TaxID=3816 RepID=A0A8B8LKA3_ABRPR|nr:F-box/FBD/LRR-repeat protein At3g14710-like [Abrus precatorius]